MSLKNNLLYHTCSLNIYNYKYYHKFRSKVDLVEATLFQMKTRLCSEVSQLDCSQGHKKKLWKNIAYFCTTDWYPLQPCFNAQKMASILTECN